MKKYNIYICQEKSYSWKLDGPKSYFSTVGPYDSVSFYNNSFQSFKIHRYWAYVFLYKSKSWNNEI